MKTLQEMALDYYITQDMMVRENNPDKQVALESHLETIDVHIKTHPDYKKQKLEDDVVNQIPKWPI